MGMSTGGGGPGSLNSDINVTPLVDVMLVLLIIFMVTAPMLNASVDLDLPQGQAAQIEDKEGKLILSIDKNRRISLGTTPVKWTELFEKLSTNQRVQQERELYVEADKTLPYGVVIQAMAIAKQAGAVKLHMVTDPNAANTDIDQWDKEIEALPPPGSKPQ